MFSSCYSVKSFVETPQFNLDVSWESFESLNRKFELSSSNLDSIATGSQAEGQKQWLE